MARCKAALKARPCDRDGHQSLPKTEAFDGSVAFKESTKSGPGRLPQAPGRYSVRCE